jgi:hypothetical protein
MWAVFKRSSPLVIAKIEEGSKAVLAKAAEVFKKSLFFIFIYFNIF